MVKGFKLLLRRSFNCQIQILKVYDTAVEDIGKYPPTLSLSWYRMQFETLTSRHVMIRSEFRNIQSFSYFFEASIPYPHHRIMLYYVFFTAWSLASSLRYLLFYLPMHVASLLSSLQHNINEPAFILMKTRLPLPTWLGSEINCCWKSEKRY